jgi:bla regulator protein blaR1
MQQSFMDILLTDAVAKAVCWTLVHSLWQGLLAALVAGAVILTTRKSAAVLRYNLLTADLVLFLAAAVGTFACELRAGEGATPVGVVVVDGVQAVAGKVAIHARYAVGAPSMIERVGVFLNEHAGVVVMLWMVCLLMQLLRMTGGLYRIHRLRRRRVFLPSEFWRERMVVLMERLGIDKKVALLQSGSVTMPVTFGFLKPSILVPLGLLANLPAEQVETILLHELAHIRRSDYLANLLLHIGEAVFFFNPGVRWVAWLVRQEREACCDDLVLAGTRDRNSYFEALIAFGEYRIGKGSMALPLGGGKSDLLWRIRRMLNQENKKLHLMEKTILSFGLMAVLAIGLVSMKGTGAAPGIAGPVVRVAGRTAAAQVSFGVVADTVPVAIGKKPGAAVKSPVAVRDTAGASSVMVDSMTVSATAETPAPVAPVTAIAVPVGNHVAPVTAIEAPVGDPIAPVTTIARPKAAVGNSVTTKATNFTESSGSVTGVTASAAPSAGNNSYMDPIIADLKARGLIQSENPLSFRLNVHGLWVNGVQQPAEVYQAFKEKYINNLRNSYHYSLEAGSVYSSVGLTNE